MNPSKNKILVWAVIFLIIANVAVLATILIMHNKQGHQRGTPADYLVKELDLNEDQQNKLHTLAKEHHEQSEKIKEQIKKSRENFFNLISQSKNDSSKNIDSLRLTFLSETTTKLRELEQLTFDHFKQIRAICTPQQQKKFDEIIEDVLQMIASGPPQGPQGNDHMPPPGDRRPPPEH